MKCKYCHAEIDNDSVFCPNCGKKLEVPKSQPTTIYKPWLIALLAVILCILLGLLFFNPFEKKGKGDLDRTEQPEREELAKAKTDSINKGDSAKRQQQLLQDSLMMVAKTKSDSLQQIKDSLNNLKKQDKEEAKKEAKKEAAPAANAAPSRSLSAVTRRDVSLVTGTKNLGYGTFRGTFRNGKPHDVNGRLVFKTTHQIDSHDPKGRVAEPGDYVIGEFFDGHLVQGIWYDINNQVKGSIIIGR